MQSNPELRAIFEQDQADRRGDMPPDIWERDQARRARVEELLNTGGVRSGEDYLNAAFVFQHGDKLEHYWQAHELALQAVDLGHGHPARWLAAAAYDRWLMHQGLPQKFGTQYRQQGARFVLHEVDPATSDEERARWNVPSLAEAQHYADDLSRNAQQELQRVAGTKQDDPPETLAVVELPGLRVGLVALAPQEFMFQPDAMPAPTPLSAAQPHPLPSYLPPGLEPRQLGDGYCAVDASGAFQVTWIELLLPAGHTLHLAWNLAEGPAPQLQPLALGERPGVFMAASWSVVSAERLPLVVTRAGPDTCWLVGGRVSAEELARVAASLPGS